MKIAVIDSGVDQKDPHLLVVPNIVALPGAHDDGIDKLGHGTAVMTTIQDRAPQASYYSLKLFSADLRSTVSQLFNALEWTLANQIDIVNLSLGVPNLAFQSEFEQMVRRACSNRTLLVCARSASGKPILPGCLPGVISVELDQRLPRDGFAATTDESGNYFTASGTPLSQPRPHLAGNLKGVSFAVANMTGFVALTCAAIGSHEFETVRTALSLSSCPQKLPFDSQPTHSVRYAVQDAIRDHRYRSFAG